MDRQQGLECEFSNVGSMCLQDGMQKVTSRIPLAATRQRPARLPQNPHSLQGDNRPGASPNPSSRLTGLALARSDSGCTGFPERAQVGGEIARRGQGVGVVVAEHPAAAGHRVLVQLAGCLILAQVPQVKGEVVRRGQGVGVVVAAHAALAGQGVLVQLAGRLMLAQAPQVVPGIRRP
jgi:hypothetical protein